MATKKNDKASDKNTANGADGAAEALKKATAEVKAKFPDMPKRGIELVAQAKIRKLTRPEVLELRAMKLKKSGEPLTAKKGPRESSPVNVASIVNAVDLMGAEAITKMHAKHGAKMKRAFAGYLKTLKNDAEALAAMTTLGRQLFPSNRKGFVRKDAQTVGKSGRVAVLVSDAGIANGSTVKREVLTLADGRRGVFVWQAPQEAAPAAIATVPAAQPAAPFGNA